MFTYPDDHPFYLRVREEAYSPVTCGAECYVYLPGDILTDGRDRFYVAPAVPEVWEANFEAHKLLEESGGSVLEAGPVDEVKHADEENFDPIEAPRGIEHLAVTYSFKRRLSEGLSIGVEYHYEQERIRGENLVGGSVSVALEEDGKRVPTMQFLEHQAKKLIFAECTRRFMQSRSETP